jgi:SAM-dependent methyltransferase
LKKNIEIKKIKGINYIYHNGKKIRYKPWLGDLLSFLYDPIMEKSVFPKKFEASIGKHDQFLAKECKDFHNCTILELAAGSGNVSDFLPVDNKYIGIDVSEGLLKIAYKKFIKNNFIDFDLYLCPAENVPLQDGFADVCICNLSLNFFNDLEAVIKEIKRVLKAGGLFICSVPVTERNEKQSVIRGNLNSEIKLKDLFEGNGFEFDSCDMRNGALLYFKAVKN